MKRIFIISLSIIFSLCLHAQDVTYQSVIDPSSYSISTSSIAGKTQGSLSVSGLLNYSIPIDLPKGTAGLQPSLGLVYSSGFNDGPLGIGWQIAGLSSITRVPQNQYYDSTADVTNGDLTDKYAIDGKRMTLTAGTYGAASSKYGTELEDFTKIVAYGTTGYGPEYFEAYTKSGLIYEYGNTTDSKLKLDDLDCIVTWKLNKIIDRFDNYITFTYDASDDEHPISLIEYTGNTSQPTDPFASIQFQYKDRDGVSSYVHAGQIYERDILLDRIEIEYNENSYKAYQIKYISDSYPQLQTVTEIGNDDASYNPTVFSWTTEDESYNYDYSFYPKTIKMSFDDNLNPIVIEGKERFFHGDFNGDGRTDFVKTEAKTGNYTDTDYCKLYLSDADGTPVLTDSFALQNYFQDFIVADLNADGLCDLVEVALEGTYDFYSCLSTGDGFNIPNHYWHVDYVYDLHTAVDYNGDGVKEIMVFNKNGDYQLYEYPNGSKDSSGDLILSGTISSFGTYMGYHTGNEYAPISDFNGDGCSDILVLGDGSTSKIYEFKGTNNVLTQTHLISTFNSSSSVALGDINGDGNTDILSQDDSFDMLLTCIIKDDEEQTYTISGFSNYELNKEYNRFRVYDINGDGNEDIIIIGKGEGARAEIENNDPNKINIAINNGDGSFSFQDEYTAPVDFTVGFYGSSSSETWEIRQNTSFFYFGDYNGDGFNEFFYNDSITSVHFSFMQGTPGHLLYNIIDGLGAQTEVTYKPMTNEDVYTIGTGASYPLCDFSSPQQLVYAVETDNGYASSSNNTTTISYTYEGAQYHCEGKGFVGFTQQTETNSSTQIINTKSYSIDSDRYYPKLTNVSYKTSSNTSISDASYTWSEISLSNDRVFPYISEKVEDDFLKDFTVTTSYEYNSYGNPTSVEVDYGDSHTYTSTYIYGDEDEDEWLIGRPTTITETWEDGSSTKTNVVTRTYFSTTNSPDVDIHNSGDDAYWKLDRAYDEFGNLSEKKVSTTGLSDQYTTYTYDSAHGVNLENVTDPTGNDIDYDYSSTTGWLETKTDHFDNEINYTYDGMGRVATEISDLGTTETITRSLVVSSGPDYARYYVKVTGNDGSSKIFWYDILGREIRNEEKLFSGGTAQVDRQYTEEGWLSYVSEPSTGTPDMFNETEYDSYGRISTVTPAYEAAETYSYNDETTTITKNSRTYKVVEDAAGQITSRYDPGGTITYNYWPNGLLKSVVAPGSVTTSLTYDKNGNRLTITDPSAGTITNTYYGTGAVKTQENENGDITTYTYQSDGLLDKYTTTEGETNYSYNSDNLVSSITTPEGVTRTYTYDSNGRVASVTESLGGISNVVSYEYDSYGRLYKKYFNGTSDYEQYDYTNGYLYRIKFNGTTVWQMTEMDAQKRTTAATVGSVATTWTYDSDNNLISNIDATDVQDDVCFFNDNTGNLIYRQDVLNNVLVEVFAHDSNDRLLSSSGTALSARDTITVSYDNNGNILTKSDAGTYSYSETPYAVTGITDGVNIDTAKQAIEYYSFEKVKTIEEGGKTAEFVYNPDGQRIRMVLSDNGTVSKTHYYFGSSCEREIVSGVTTQYIWIGGNAYTAVAVAKKTGSGSWTVYNIFRDYLGSITHLKTGSTVYDYSFDAWGRRRSADEWSYTLDSNDEDLIAGRGFTGHEHLEDFNLINMNGRLYDPVLGRFLSPDPYVQEPSFTQSFNRYSYCLNNPLKYTDPTGEKWKWKYLNPLHWMDEGMQWANDKTTKLRQKMVEWKIPSFGAGYNSTYGTGFYVGDNPMQYPGYEAKISEGLQNIDNHLGDVRQTYGESWMEASYSNAASSNGGNDPYMNSHGEPVYTMDEFIQANKGLTRNEIINQRQDRSKTFLGSQPGGPTMRYVTNPHDGRVLDMRHMLVVGKQPAAIGNLLEVFQWGTGQASGMDPQDFYSNGVGYQFYMQSSSLQRLIAPTTFTDQLNKFFSNPRVIYNW